MNFEWKRMQSPYDSAFTQYNYDIENNEYGFGVNVFYYGEKMGTLSFTGGYDYAMIDIYWNGECIDAISTHDIDNYGIYRSTQTSPLNFEVECIDWISEWGENTLVNGGYV